MGDYPNMTIPPNAQISQIFDLAKSNDLPQVLAKSGEINKNRQKGGMSGQPHFLPKFHLGRILSDFMSHVITSTCFHCFGPPGCIIGWWHQIFSLFAGDCQWVVVRIMIREYREIVLSLMSFMKIDMWLSLVFKELWYNILKTLVKSEIWPRHICALGQIVELR
jgi:hypothetical protein